MKTIKLAKDPFFYYKITDINVGENKDVKLIRFKDYQIGYHEHDFYELNFVTEGKGLHFFGDKIFTVSKGDVFVVPLKTEHGYINQEGLNVTHLIFNDDFFDRHSEIFFRNMEFSALFHLEPQLKRLYGIDSSLKLSQTEMNDVSVWLDNIEQQQSIRSPETVNITDGLAVSLLFLLFRIYREKNKSVVGKYNVISSVLDFIYQHYQEGINLYDLANISGYSRTNFFRFFKNVLRYSPAKFIMKCKIDTAKHMLTETDYTLTEIAQECGFYDSAHFIRSFKKHTSMTPKQFRKKTSSQE